MKKIFPILLSFLSFTLFAQAPTVQITKEESDKGMEEFAANVATQTYIYGLPMMLNYRFANIARGLVKKGEDPNFKVKFANTELYTNVKEEAIYPQIILDENGEKLTGKYKYELTIPKDKVAPAKAFWSLITYQGSDFVPNKYYHYSVGDDKQFPVKRNSNGSVTILFSHEPPKGDLSNWLPTPEEGKDFRILYRIYVPIPEVLTAEGIDSYLPPVKKVD